MWERLDSAPRSVRVYLRAIEQYGRAQRVASGALTGVFLGWMDQSALEALDIAAYDNVRESVADVGFRYEDAEHIRSGLTDWERDALSSHLEPGDRVLITSAGAGREVFGALEMGLAPIGYEPHSGMHTAGEALLAAEGHPGLLHRCERDTFPRDAPDADGVLVGWGSYSHITPSSIRLAFLRDARARLQPGRPLVVSFWMLPSLERQLGITYRIARLIRYVRRLAPPERGDLLMPHFLHAFTEKEICSELASAGFGDLDLRLEPYPHVVALAC